MTEALGISFTRLVFIIVGIVGCGRAPAGGPQLFAAVGSALRRVVMFTLNYAVSDAERPTVKFGIFVEHGSQYYYAIIVVHKHGEFTSFHQIYSIRWIGERILNYKFILKDFLFLALT